MGRQRGDVGGGKAETGDDDAGDQAALVGREPFERGWRGGGVPEGESRADQAAEADHPSPVIHRMRDQQETHADQNAADEGRDTRSESILHSSGRDHRECEHQARQGIGVVDRGEFPAEGRIPAGDDGVPDGFLEHAPAVEYAQCQIDAGAGQDNRDAAIVFHCISRRSISPCGYAGCRALSH